VPEKQISFSEAQFAAMSRVTRRERFLADMERVIPGHDVRAIIEPHYPKGKRGRPQIGLERILRVYLIQHWYGLLDERMEDAIADIQALRGFVRIGLSPEAVPDQTTLLQFRHLLEEKDLSKAILAAINAQLKAKGLMMREGTIADVTQTAEVLHREERTVYLDAGYTGVEKREKLKDRDIDWQVATKRSKLKAIPKESKLGPLLRRLESVKASIRSKVEQPFYIVKNLFSRRKILYKGLKKKTAQLHIFFALANLVIAEGFLLAPRSQGAF